MTTQLVTSHWTNSIRHQMIHVLNSMGFSIFHEHEVLVPNKISEKEAEDKFYSKLNISPELVRRQMSLM